MVNIVVVLRRKKREKQNKLKRSEKYGRRDDALLIVVHIWKNLQRKENVKNKEAKKMERSVNAAK